MSQADLMKHQTLSHIFLLATALLSAPTILAQDEAPAAEPAPTENKAAKGASHSQEVEYNEDNYRRFMELRDQQTEHSNLPTNAYQSGLKKLDELPEASQKHLRNQLREIILEGDAWAPGDEDKEYPYVASEGAQKDPELQQQEAEAWGELVGKYNEREAQIYAGAAAQSAAGAQAGEQQAAQAGSASGAEGDSAADSNSEAGNDGAGEQQPGQQQQSESASAQDSYSPNAASNRQDPNAKSTGGVSQNAMEFLLQSGSIESQDGEAENSGAASTASTAGNTTAAASTESESTAGSTQNALQFLANGESQSPNEPQAGSETADGGSQPAEPPAGTLAIEDLVNAQGLSGSDTAGQVPVLEPKKEKDPGGG